LTGNTSNRSASGLLPVALSPQRTVSLPDLIRESNFKNRDTRVRHKQTKLSYVDVCRAQSTKIEKLKTGTSTSSIRDPEALGWDPGKASRVQTLTKGAFGFTVFDFSQSALI
jgi:hypothetical protein